MAVLYSPSRRSAGDSFTLKSFVIVLLGGLGSMPGAIVAAMVLGVAENLVSRLLRSRATATRSASCSCWSMLVWLARGLFGKPFCAEIARASCPVAAVLAMARARRRPCAAAISTGCACCRRSS